MSEVERCIRCKIPLQEKIINGKKYLICPNCDFKTCKL